MDIRIKMMALGLGVSLMAPAGMAVAEGESGWGAQPGAAGTTESGTGTTGETGTWEEPITPGETGTAGETGTTEQPGMTGETGTSTETYRTRKSTSPYDVETTTTPAPGTGTTGETGTWEEPVTPREPGISDPSGPMGGGTDTPSEPGTIGETGTGEVGASGGAY